MKGKQCWSPDILMRAARNVENREKEFDVIDCEDWTTTSISIEFFFRSYLHYHGDVHDAAGRPLPMLKLKDFPAEDSFANKCQRHNSDFIGILNTCLPEYMHPVSSALNLASKLPVSAVPPDLGPKGYIAFGREKEVLRDGDSVTRLHEDLSDAVNIMTHVQYPPDTAARPAARCGEDPPVAPGYGGAGALWDLFRRQDAETLSRFVKDVLAGKVPNCPPFYFKGRELTQADVVHVVHDRSIMIKAAHRKAMAQPPYNLHPWLVEQYENEGVLLPVGCAHQVRNLRASIKIALDFVSPEGIDHCLQRRQQRRELAMRERPFLDVDWLRP